MNFGQQVLSHPLLVEAIETEFVPVVVHNNQKGRDAKVLARFEEPAWNNPVVRFVDAAGKDLIPRRDGVYTPDAIARRMVEALVAARRPAPAYLRLVGLGRPATGGSGSARFAKASFAMF